MDSGLAGTDNARLEYLYTWPRLWRCMRAYLVDGKVTGMRGSNAEVLFCSTGSRTGLINVEWGYFERDIDRIMSFFYLYRYGCMIILYV